MPNEESQSRLNCLSVISISTTGKEERISELQRLEAKQEVEELKEEILGLFRKIKKFKPESKLLWIFRIFFTICLVSPIAKYV